MIYFDQSYPNEALWGIYASVIKIIIGSGNSLTNQSAGTNNDKYTSTGSSETNSSDQNTTIFFHENVSEKCQLQNFGRFVSVQKGERLDYLMYISALTQFNGRVYTCNARYT